MNKRDYNEALIRGILERKDLLPGGLADHAPDNEFDSEELKMGVEHELEHTDNKQMAKEIAKDHLKEDPKYYSKKKLEESIISEKQSAAERYRKHKEWRRKNPEKVRAQVKRHEIKSRSDKSNPQTGQAARRDETRREIEGRENGKKKNPKCADCGSTRNVQYDHDNGYSKGASTTPRCHKCHTRRPQQNDKGEKSVKGGTVRVSSESKSKATPELIDLVAKHMFTIDLEEGEEGTSPLELDF
jgi:hypothetical protein